MTIYLFSSSALSSQTEILAQKQFFERVFRLYFTLINISNIHYYKKIYYYKKKYKKTHKQLYTVYKFTSIPSNDLSDVAILVGHNFLITSYLANHQLAEKNLYCITCDYHLFYLYRKQYNLFLCKQIYNKCFLFDKNAYNMKFNPTFAHLILLQAKKHHSVEECLSLAFNKIDIKEM